MSRFEFFMDRVRVLRWLLCDAYRYLFQGFKDSDLTEINDDIRRMTKLARIVRIR